LILVYKYEWSQEAQEDSIETYWKFGGNRSNGKKLETKQISERYHVFQPNNNTSTYVVQREPYWSSLWKQDESQQSKADHGSCIQEVTDTFGVESYEGSVDSYTDDTWQIVKSKKSHGWEITFLH
jgi:hypothetical protein